MTNYRLIWRGREGEGRNTVISHGCEGVSCSGGHDMMQRCNLHAVDADH